MKDEITAKLVEYLEATKDFVLDQAPDLLKQIIRYEYISSWMYFIMFTLLTIITITLAIYMHFHPSADKYSMYNLFRYLIPVVLITPFICCAFSNLDTIMQIKIAPKYFLLETLKGE